MERDNLYTRPFILDALRNGRLAGWSPEGFTATNFRSVYADGRYSMLVARDERMKYWGRVYVGQTGFPVDTAVAPGDLVQVGFAGTWLTIANAVPSDKDGTAYHLYQNNDAPHLFDAVRYVSGGESVDSKVPIEFYGFQCYVAGDADQPEGNKTASVTGGLFGTLYQPLMWDEPTGSILDEWGGTFFFGIAETSNGLPTGARFRVYDSSGMLPDIYLNATLESVGSSSVWLYREVSHTAFAGYDGCAFQVTFNSGANYSVVAFYETGVYQLYASAIFVNMGDGAVASANYDFTMFTDQIGVYGTFDGVAGVNFLPAVLPYAVTQSDLTMKHNGFNSGSAVSLPFKIGEVTTNISALGAVTGSSVGDRLFVAVGPVSIGGFGGTFTLQQLVNKYYIDGSKYPIVEIEFNL